MTEKIEIEDRLVESEEGYIIPPALKEEDENEVPLYTEKHLSVLAHRLWVHWSQHIAEEENISQERYERWQDLWIPFDQLSSEMQEKDEELVKRFLSEKPDYIDNGDENSQ